MKLALTKRDFERFIHAFITKKLDYCKALYVGVSQVSLSWLQILQKAAARLHMVHPQVRAYHSMGN